MSQEVVEKKLFEVFTSYGKGDGMESAETWVLEDTPENRQTIADDECGWADDWDGLEEFLTGKSNEASFSCYGDWDDPTGGVLIVSTYEEAHTRIVEEFMGNIRILNKQFGKDDLND